MVEVTQLREHPLFKSPPNDWNPLHCAVFRNHVDEVRLVLKSSPHLINTMDKMGWTALHLACSNYFSDAFSWNQTYKRLSDDSVIRLERLLPNPNDISTSSEAKTQIFVLLIKHGADFERLVGDREEGLTPSIIAASSGLESILKFLLFFGAPIDPHRSGTPYQWAKLKLSMSKGNSVSRVYRRLNDMIGEDGQVLVAEIESFREKLDGDIPNYEDPDKLKNPKRYNEYAAKVLQLEQKLAFLHVRSTATLTLPETPTIQICRSCYKETTSAKLQIFFPNRKISKNYYILETPDCHCDFCAIMDALMPAPDGTLRVEAEVTVNIIAAKPGMTQRLHLKRLGQSVRLDIFPPSAGMGVTSSALNLSALSNTGKEWLSSCQKEHSYFDTSSVLDTLKSSGPTRLIDVSRWKENLLRLCVGPETSSPYVAFSHRWIGGPTLWVTTKLTVQERQSWFSSVKLPQSIMDAAQVTAELGLHFIWIDSLCIIQDDENDWLQEAGRMADVYMHAEVTIFAHRAQDDRAGFLSSRICQPTVPVCLKVEKSGSPPLPTIVRYAYQLSGELSSEADACRFFHKSSNSTVFGEDMTRSHLNDRGWILQERLLSRRGLHFGHTQMYWESPSGIIAECCGAIGPDELRWVSDGREAIYGRKESMDAHDSWSQIACRFMKMKLTKPNDRLPALSGIARAFSSHSLGEYYAGLWGTTLHLDLIWIRDVSATPHASEPSQILWRQKYHCPSWSWAAANFPITFQLEVPSGVTSNCCFNCVAKCYLTSSPPFQLWRENAMRNDVVSKLEVVNAELDMIGPDPYGPLRNATLTISTCLRKAIFLGPLKSRIGYLEPGKLPIYDEELAPIGLVIFDDRKEQDQPGEILCLQVSSMNVEYGGANMLVDFMLVLKDWGENTYSRIGIAHTFIRWSSRFDKGSFFANYKRTYIKLI